MNVKKLKWIIPSIIVLFFIPIIVLFLAVTSILANGSSDTNSSGNPDLILPEVDFDGLPLACNSYVVNSDYVDNEYFQMFGNYHYAIDMTGFIDGDKTNVPVVSLFDGTVDSVSTNLKGGYGIVIYSPVYQIYVMYWHFRDVPTLRVGDEVKANDIIGIQGNTGLSTGIHLHIAVYIDQSRKITVDPRLYMPELGAKGFHITVVKKEEVIQ